MKSSSNGNEGQMSRKQLSVFWANQRNKVKRRLSGSSMDGGLVSEDMIDEGLVEQHCKAIEQLLPKGRSKFLYATPLNHLPKSSHGQETEFTEYSTPLKKNVEWLTPSQQDRSANVCLTQEIELFAQYVALTAEEQELRTQLISDLQSAVSSKWPGSSIAIFGSLAAGLSIFMSDIDAAVISPELEGRDGRGRGSCRNSVHPQLLSMPAAKRQKLNYDNHDYDDNDPATATAAEPSSSSISKKRTIKNKIEMELEDWVQDKAEMVVEMEVEDDRKDNNNNDDEEEDNNQGEKEEVEVEGDNVQTKAVAFLSTSSSSSSISFTPPPPPPPPVCNHRQQQIVAAAAAVSVALEEDNQNMMIQVHQQAVSDSIPSSFSTIGCSLLLSVKKAHVLVDIPSSSSSSSINSHPSSSASVKHDSSSAVIATTDATIIKAADTNTTNREPQQQQKTKTGRSNQQESDIIDLTMDTDDDNNTDDGEEKKNENEEKSNNNNNDDNDDNIDGIMDEEEDEDNHPSNITAAGKGEGNKNNGNKRKRFDDEEVDSIEEEEEEELYEVPPITATNNKRKKPILKMDDVFDDDNSQSSTSNCNSNSNGNSDDSDAQESDEDGDSDRSGGNSDNDSSDSSISNSNSKSESDQQGEEEHEEDDSNLALMMDMDMDMDDDNNMDDNVDGKRSNDEEGIGWMEDRQGQEGLLQLPSATATDPSDGDPLKKRKHVYYPHNFDEYDNHDDHDMRLRHSDNKHKVKDKDKDKVKVKDKDKDDMMAVEDGLELGLLQGHHHHANLNVNNNLFSSNNNRYRPRLNEDQLKRERKQLINNLSRIANQLANRDYILKLELRSRAKVPIVHIDHRCCGLEVDLACGLDQQDTVVTVQALLTVGGGLAVLYPLAAILKVFLAQLGLDKPFSGGLGSFKLYVLLALHAQSHSDLLGSNDTSSKEQPPANLGLLLLTFFKHFGVTSPLTTETTVSLQGLPGIDSDRAVVVSFAANSLMPQVSRAFKGAYIALTQHLKSRSSQQQPSSKSSSSAAVSSSALARIIDTAALAKQRQSILSSAKAWLMERGDKAQQEQRAELILRQLEQRLAEKSGGPVLRLSLDQLSDDLKGRLLSYSSLSRALTVEEEKRPQQGLGQGQQRPYKGKGNKGGSISSADKKKMARDKVKEKRLLHKTRRAANRAAKAEATVWRQQKEQVAAAAAAVASPSSLMTVTVKEKQQQQPAASPSSLMTVTVKEKQQPAAEKIAKKQVRRILDEKRAASTAATAVQPKQATSPAANKQRSNQSSNNSSSSSSGGGNSQQQEAAMAKQKRIEELKQQIAIKRQHLGNNSSNGTHSSGSGGGR